MGLGPGESPAGWAIVALLGAFFGFMAGCVGVAWGVYGEWTPMTVALATLGGLAFVAGAFSYLPLSASDFRRAHERAVLDDPPGFALPLGPGSPVRVGRIWSLHVVAVVPLAVFWLVFLVIVQAGAKLWAVLGWLAVCCLMTAAVFLVRYSALVGVAQDGLELRGMTGSRLVRFSEIRRWTVVPMRNGLPHAAALYRRPGRFAPAIMVPLFDVRLCELLESKVGPMDSGHT